MLAKQLVNLRKQKNRSYATGSRINAIGNQQKVRYEPCHNKTGLRGFGPGLTQTGMYSHRKRLEAGNLAGRCTFTEKG